VKVRYKLTLTPEAEMVRKVIGIFVLILFLLGAALAHADGPTTLGLGTLTALALSPDGARLAVGTTVGVYFYDAQTLAPQAFWGTGYPVGRVLWSPRGDVMALVHRAGETTQRLEVRASADGAVLWSQTEASPSECWDYGWYRYCTTSPHWRWKWAFSPDGAQIAIAHGSAIELREAAGGALHASLGAGAAPQYESLAFSAAGRLVACCSDNQTQVWEPASQQVVRLVWTQTGFLAVSPDGRRMSTEGKMLWDLDQPRFIGRISGGEDVASAAFSPDGQLVATGSGYGPVRVWSVGDRAMRQLLLGHRSSVHDVAWAPDGAQLYSAGDNTLRVWDARTGEQLRMLDGFNPAVRRVAWSADGRRIVYNVGGQLAAADLASRLPVAAAPLQSSQVCQRRAGASYDYCYNRVADVTALSASPAGDVIAVATSSDIALYDATTLRLLRLLPTNYRVFQVAFDATGERLASGGDSPYAVVWEVKTGLPQRLVMASPDKAFVIALAFGPDGQTLDTLDAGGRYARWDLGTGAPLAQAQLPESVHDVRLCWSGMPARQAEYFRDECGYQVGRAAISPAAGRIAIQHGQGLVVADAATGRALYTLEAPGLRAVAVNAPGTRLAAAFGDDVKVWKLDTGEPVLEYQHTAVVSDLAFSPDGGSLASGGRDGVTQVWPVP
jgi:WD40 repeat protein